MKTPVGLIFDDSRHFLDHLAPFCALQGWPLIICEDEIADLARRYYPGLEVIEKNRWDLTLPSHVVACDSRGLIDSTFGVDRSRKLLWLPHGNSDKGWKIPFFDPLRGETALVYGQRMIDFMGQKNVSPQAIRIGNFRLQYWLEHRSFYDKEFSLPNGKNYLYAPTWNDAEGNGTFWEMFPLLAASLPDTCNLLVKLHPNTQKRFAPEIEQLIGRYIKKTNLVFLPEIPPIYPLLNLCDVYIGDMSSIGYDFLYWKRPMFFLKGSNRSQFLYSCGKEIAFHEIGSIFTQPIEDRKEIQRQVYAYTFDPYSRPQFGF